MSQTSLRRAAVLISSLPPEVAARILATMSPQQRQRVRLETRNLGPISDAERQRTIAEFMRHSATSPSNSAADKGADATSSEGSFHVPDFVRQPNLPPRHSPDPTATPPTGFEFLCDVSDEFMECALKNEPPHAVAVVLANVAPDQAARLLKRMPLAVREQIVQRLHRIDHIPPDTLADIGEHLRQTLAAHNSRLQAPGRRALSAIVAHLDSETIDSLRQIVPEVDSMRPTAPDKESEAIPEVAPAAAQDVSESASSRPALRIAPGTAEASQTSSPGNPPSGDESGFQLSFEELQQLPPSTLRRLLAEIDPEAAVLALLGMRVEVAEGVLATLAKRQERQVRRELASLGPLLLRDIDRAKGDLLEAAHKLQRLGLLTNHRSLAAVA